MSINKTEITQTEKSQYAILSNNLINNKKGTLLLKNNRLSFTDTEGEILVDVDIADIIKYKHNHLSLKIFASGANYKFIFSPPNAEKVRWNALNVAFHPGVTRLNIIEAQMNDSGILNWVHKLDKLGIPNGRRNSFAYSLLFVIVPVLIFTSLALYGNIIGAGAETVPRSYPEMIFELAIIGACFAGFAYTINKVRKNK